MRIIIESAKVILIALIAQFSLEDMAGSFGPESDWDARTWMEAFADESGLESASGFFECEANPSLSMFVKQMGIKDANDADFLVRAYYDGEALDMLQFEAKLFPAEAVVAGVALGEKMGGQGFDFAESGTIGGSLNAVEWRLYGSGSIGLLATVSQGSDIRMSFSILLFRLGDSEPNIAAWNRDFGGRLFPEEALEFAL